MNTLMTLTETTSTITITHDGVYVTASGKVKIAASERKFWRIWVYNEAADVWELQRNLIFKRHEREKAVAAAALLERT